MPKWKLHLKQFKFDMNRIIETAKKNWPYIVGAIGGGVGGYLYWYFIGCNSGTCPITSSPTMSVIWGAVMGSLLLSMIFGRKK